MFLSDGTFAILKPLATVASSFSQPIETKIHQRFGLGSISSGSTISNHLRCSICHGLFVDAVLTPCCGETFCRPCVISRISSSHDCPSCHEKINSADLESNRVIQDSVEAVLRVGRLQTGVGAGANQVDGSIVKEEEKSSQSLPPGTIRLVEVSGAKPIPLGGRLKRPFESTIGGATGGANKKQLLIK